MPRPRHPPRRGRSAPAWSRPPPPLSTPPPRAATLRRSRSNGSAGRSSAVEHMRISAKADYAVRAAVEMAAAGDAPLKGEKIAEAQGIPLQFLEHILLELKHARLVRARRGARGGYWLAQPPDEITLASVIRAVEGPLANIQDQAPEQTKYPGNAEALSDVWIAVRASLRRVLESVTIADLRDGKIPGAVKELTRDDGAWVTR